MDKPTKFYVEMNCKFINHVYKVKAAAIKYAQAKAAARNPEEDAIRVLDNNGDCHWSNQPDDEIVTA
jgi:hypothetical protein